MRYYVYSIECGYPPNSPLFESDDYAACVDVCTIYSVTTGFTFYVVDRTPCTMYDEVYVHTSKRFQQDYDDMVRRRQRLRDT